MSPTSPTSVFQPEFQLGSLDVKVTRLEQLQLLRHAIAAEEVEILSDCFTYAVQHSQHVGGSREIAHRSVRAEIAAATRATETTVNIRLGEAVALVDKFPRTLTLLQNGEISYRHATTISKAGGNIVDTEKRQQYENAALEYAVTATVRKLEQTVKFLAEQFIDVPLTERHEQAKQLRRVEVRDLDDGMAELFAVMPATEAYAVLDRIARMAWTVKKCATEDTAEATAQDADEGTTKDAVQETAEDVVQDTAADPADHAVDDAAEGSLKDSVKAAVKDVRSIHEIRTDVFTDLLLAGTPSPELAGKGLGSIKAIIQVTVPDASLQPVPLADPGVTILSTYGPVDEATARELASHETKWLHVNTNPVTGEFISIDSYAPSQKLRDQLRVRDIHCRFPGCRAPITRCDLDHTIDAALGGPTNSENLAHLCRGHHVLKHNSGWTLVQLPGGVIEWTSPTGRTYTDQPASRVMFKEIHDNELVYSTAVPSRPLFVPRPEPPPGIASTAMSAVSPAPSKQTSASGQSAPEIDTTPF